MKKIKCDVCGAKFYPEIGVVRLKKVKVLLIGKKKQQVYGIEG